MLGKSWEFWAVVLGMSLYVVTRDAEKEPLAKRLVKTAASGLLAFGMAPNIAPYVRDNEITAAVLIMAFGLIALDLGTALILDRELIKELIRKRFGGSE